MAKVPERGLTDQLSENVVQIMRNSTCSTETEPTASPASRGHGWSPDNAWLRASRWGKRESFERGSIASSPFTSRTRLRFENLADLLAKKATQANTVEVYVQINHREATRTKMREWMQDLANEVRAGRRDSLRRIHVQAF